MRFAGFVFSIVLPALFAFVPGGALAQEKEQTREEESVRRTERTCFVIGYPHATGSSLDGKSDVNIPFGALVQTRQLDTVRIVIKYHGEEFLVDSTEVLRTRDAHHFITERIKDDPTPDNYGFLAHLLHKMVKYQPSIEAADRGLSQDPKHVECLAFRASSCFYSGDVEGAMETASRLSESTRTM